MNGWTYIEDQKPDLHDLADRFYAGNILTRQEQEWLIARVFELRNEVMALQDPRY